MPNLHSIYQYGWSIICTILLLACSKNTNASVDSRPENPVDTVAVTYTYLALGDSYTIGEGVAAPQRWPNQLMKALNENEKNVLELDIIAKTGWTTKNLLDAISMESPEPHDIVSLLIGVNNQYQGLSFEQFKIEFDSLLGIAVSLSDDKVFVVSIPDYGVTPFGASNSEQIGQELDKYNAYMEQVAQSQDIPFVNITDISRDLGDSQDALASDNLHPSGTQYGWWVEAILPVALKLLEE